MDRLSAYNFVLAHIPGSANAAADFLSRMQTDPTQSLELQLLDSTPVKQIYIDMKTKTPNSSMFLIEWPENQQKKQFNQQYLEIYWSSYIKKTLYRILYLISMKF